MKYFKLFILLLLCLGLNAQINESVNFNSGDLSLNATFSSPSTEGPFPVAILIHGSGANDRDQTLLLTGGNAQCLYPSLHNQTIKNFKDLSEQLQSHGIAVLRYDKRSFTYGSTLNAETISPYDFIDDVNAAIDYVKTRTDIDTNRIFLIGHSQGANFNPLVANERNDIAAFISMGTVSRGIDTILALQFRHLYYYCLNDTAQGDATYNQTLNDFSEIRNFTWSNNTPYLNVYPLFWRDWMDITDSTIYHFNQATQPMLFLHASDDFNVPIEDAQLLQNNLNSNFDFYYMNDLNHYFTESTTPTLSEAVGDTIYYWLNNKFGLSSVNNEYYNHDLLHLSYSHDFIHLSSPTERIIEQISLLNIEGKEVYHEMSINSFIFTLNKNRFSNGFYVLSVKIDEDFVFKKILIN
ncbi:MAG: alpha/beta fold hydrolase [Flavobacteriales bacterium]|nr:alpha/beta fold hydrolase [Flavobacteriales bacterium]